MSHNHNPLLVLPDPVKVSLIPTQVAKARLAKYAPDVVERAHPAAYVVGGDAAVEHDMMVTGLPREPPVSTVFVLKLSELVDAA